MPKRLTSRVKLTKKSYSSKYLSSHKKIMTSKSKLKIKINAKPR